jgi:phage gp36-like protein
MWRIPTVDDFRAAILEDEMAAFDTASVAPGIDPTAKAITAATGIFRSALRSGFKGKMGIAGTLPQDLIPQAMHVAVYYYLAGRTGFIVSDGRTTLYNDAIRLTRDIATGKYQYTDPDDLEEEEAPSNAFNVPVFQRKRLTLRRDQQEGI